MPRLQFHSDMPVVSLSLILLHQCKCQQGSISGVVVVVVVDIVLHQELPQGSVDHTLKTAVVEKQK